MQDHIGMGVLAKVDRDMADRREIAQEAYDAFEFGAKIVAPKSAGGFFFSFHREEPVVARKILVIPEDGGTPVAAFFCVAFAENSRRVTKAFAFTGSGSYFGQLPDQFIDSQPRDEDCEPPRMFM